MAYREKHNSRSRQQSAPYNPRSVGGAKAGGFSGSCRSSGTGPVEGSERQGRQRTNNFQNYDAALYETKHVSGKETDPHRLSQRQKQIDYGKNTKGYDNYVRLIPKSKRDPCDKNMPRTPDKFEVQSKKCWDGRITAWRARLHLYDDKGQEQGQGQGGEGEEEGAPFSLYPFSVTDAKENESGYNSKSIKDNFDALKKMAAGLSGSGSATTTTATEAASSYTNIDRCAALIDEDEVEYDDDLL